MIHRSAKVRRLFKFHNIPIPARRSFSIFQWHITDVSKTVVFFNHTWELVYEPVSRNNRWKITKRISISSSKAGRGLDERESIRQRRKGDTKLSEGQKKGGQKRKKKKREKVEKLQPGEIRGSFERVRSRSQHAVPPEREIDTCTTLTKIARRRADTTARKNGRGKERNVGRKNKRWWKMLDGLLTSSQTRTEW